MNQNSSRNPVLISLLGLKSRLNKDLSCFQSLNFSITSIYRIKALRSNYPTLISSLLYSLLKHLIWITVFIKNYYQDLSESLVNHLASSFSIIILNPSIGWDFARTKHGWILYFCFPFWAIFGSGIPLFLAILFSSTCCRSSATGYHLLPLSFPSSISELGVMPSFWASL